MKILGRENNLENTLTSFSNRDIKIITAFASSTEDLIDHLLSKNNNVDIILGTINAFSSPRFIDYCSAHEDSNLSIHVDFRYQVSCHWKLYLIEPNIVIVGSANFTKTGISLERDTLVFLEDDSLYAQYISLINEIKKNPIVVDSKDENRFQNLLEEYREKHSKMQKALSKATQHKNVESWLADESNQMLPLFIWDSTHSEETVQKANELIESSDLEITREDVKDFSTYECSENELPYEEGDIVLTASSKGSYIQFQTFDRIMYVNGIHYIYSFKKKRYKYPFKLDSVKKELKLKIPEWFSDECIEIHRDEISSLLMAEC